MPKTKRLKTILQAARPLAVVACVLVTAAPLGPARAQDALSDRYQAIRAPTQIQANRIARQQLQSELRALRGAETRIRSDIRRTERLQFQDPISRLPAQQRRLRGQLDRLDIDQRAAAAELSRLDRESRTLPEARRLSVGPFDPDAPVTAYTVPGVDPPSSEEAVAAAREFVDDLLRANQARP